MVDKGFGLVLLAGKDEFQKPPTAIVVDVSGNKAAFEEMLSAKIIPRLKTFAEKLALESEDFDGVKVYKFTPPGQGKQPGYFGVIGDTFAMGTEAGVKALIATSKGQPNIGSVAAFQSAKQATAIDAGAFVYVNLGAVLGGKEAEEDSARKKALDALGINGVQCISASATFEGKGVRERVFVVTGKEKSGLLKHFADQPAKAPVSVALVPQGFSLYLALQSGGGPKVYQALKAFVQEVAGDEGLARFQAVEQTFQQQAQLDIEQDIFGPMGNEAFAAVDLRKLVEVLPERKPNWGDVQFIAGVEAQDAARLESSLAQLFFSQFFVQQGITVNKVRYKDSDLNVISDPRRPNVAPTYAFLDKFFVVASSTDAMKLVVDAREAKKSLATSEDFTQVQASLPKESNFTAYFDTKSVLPALLTAASEKGPLPLRPFLPALKTLADRMTGIGVALVNAPDGIRGEAYSPIGGPFWLVTLASLGNLTKSPVESKVAQTMRRMGQTEFAIRRFREATGRYPTTLAELVPEYLKKEPTDPFSPDHASLGYVLLAGGAAVTVPPAAPGAPPQAGAPAPKPEGPAPSKAEGPPRTPGEIAYLLISIGPDGKKDIDPLDPNITQLLSKFNSQNPDDIALLKSKIYQYKKEIYPEKRALNDTGDIIRPGR
jgi:hypothetical protein